MITKEAKWLGKGVRQLLPKTHDEWLEARKLTIGGSEVSAVLGINPYCSPYQLFKRKRAEIEGKSEEAKSIIMDIGHYLEPMVADYWQKATEKDVILNTAGDWIAVNERYPYAHVSPDRLYYIDTKGGKRGIIECKTTRRREFDIDDVNDPTFLSYFCQLQWGMGIMGLSQGSLAVLQYGFTDRFSYKSFDFNEDFFNTLYSKVESFMVNNVLADIEPEASSVDDIKEKFTEINNDSSITATADILAAYQELLGIREQIAVLDSQKTALEDTIKLAMQDSAAISHEGRTLVTWKQSAPSSTFDKKRFASDHPELYKQYTTETPGSRRFNIKK